MKEIIDEIRESYENSSKQIQLQNDMLKNQINNLKKTI